MAIRNEREPLLTPLKNEETPKDWLKIGAIVAAVAGALIAALAVSCIMGIFPLDFVGGKLGAGITLITGAAILLPAALIIYKRW